MLIFDLETNGLLDKLDTVHCAWTVNTETDEWTGYRPEDVEQLWLDLRDYTGTLVAHNGLGFDLEALKLVYGHQDGFEEFYTRCHDTTGTKFIDSIILSRLLYPDIRQMDWAMINKGKPLPAKFAGSHALKAWGYRLGVLKGEFPVEDFETFSEEMYEYNKQDVVVTKALMERFLFKLEQLAGEDDDLPMCVEIEHRFALYLEHQQQAGVTFDRDKADLLLKYWRRELSRRMVEMRARVPDIVVEDTIVPKVSNKRYGYEAGVPFTKRKVIPFNPRSNDHIIFFLTEKYDWQPQEYTNKKSEKWPQGKPKVTHDILRHLDYPEAPLLARIRLLTDRIGLVESSPSSWIKNINPDTGRIHGRIVHNGTPTSRCRHSRPNLGNIPSEKATWGPILRELFQPADGYKMVGCDADGLEMRLLAHYLHPFDDGAFFEAAFNGSKEDGTDAHSLNRVAINDELTQAGFGVYAFLSRDGSKTIFYACIYGAFFKKLCQIMMADIKADVPPRKQYLVGSVIMDGLKRGIVGLDELISEFEEIYEEAQAEGKWPHLFMPDGRPAPVRGKHAILNTACQTLGAVVIKVATVVFWMKMEEAGLKIRRDWNPLLHVHDELQVEVRLDLKPIDGVPAYEYAGRLASQSIEEAGRILGLRVPLVGNYATGNSWRDTH